MKVNKSFLAIIPARGSSKRLPKKNVLDLAGKPLIAWTIDAAKGSKYIDKIVLTTDDSEILKIANDMQIPTIIRPAVLASDTATSVDVVEHAIQHENGVYDFIILLQPTSPLRTAKHIDEAIELLIEKHANAVISVCETEHSPLWANTIPENGSLDGFIRDEIKNKRSQDLPKCYRLNGAIYICDVKKFINEKTFFIESDIFAYKMQRQHSVDIDELFDLKLAELFI